MAVLTLDITVTPAEVTRVVAAYQSAANTSINGTATQGQVLAFIRQQIMQKIKDDVRAHEQRLLISAIVLPALINPS